MDGRALSATDLAQLIAITLKTTSNHPTTIALIATEKKGCRRHAGRHAAPDTS